MIVFFNPPLYLPMGPLDALRLDGQLTVTPEQVSVTLPRIHDRGPGRPRTFATQGGFTTRTLAMALDRAWCRIHLTPPPPIVVYALHVQTGVLDFSHWIGEDVWPRRETQKPAKMMEARVG